MTKRIKISDLPEFDAAEYLNSEEDIAAYLTTVIEENDPALLAAALGDIARTLSLIHIFHRAERQFRRFPFPDGCNINQLGERSLPQFSHPERTGFAPHRWRLSRFTCDDRLNFCLDRCAVWPLSLIHI